jgi:cellulose synthase/poly-beta-1,6-N-acetylglucosamine synthase-like glycosyltransferase
MIYLCLFITIIYASLILWLFEGLKNKQRNLNIQDITEYPFVSVIVSARNEACNLNQLFEQLYQQTYPHDKFEILIANDRSTDSTEEILKDYSKKDNVSYISIDETPLGWAPKKWALHSLIQQSKGELILQTDADCIPSVKWVETIVKVFTNENLGMVSAPAPLTSQNSTLNTLYELDSLAQDGFSAAGFSRNLVFSCTGRNLAMRKSVFEEIDGYDGIEHFISGDDDLLMQKLSQKTDYEIQFLLDKDAIVESPGPTSIQEFIHQRLRFASKGLDYFKISTSQALRVVLPILYFTNLMVVFSIIRFTETASIMWLLPWFIKTSSDFILTSFVLTVLKRTWNTSLFVLLSFIHPIYITIFGALGPFKAIKWKS